MRNFYVLYRENGETKTEWFGVITDAFKFAREHRPCFVYNKDGQLVQPFKKEEK